MTKVLLDFFGFTKAMERPMSESQPYPFIDITIIDGINDKQKKRELQFKIDKKLEDVDGNPVFVYVYWSGL